METGVGGQVTLARFNSNLYTEPTVENGVTVTRQQQFTLSGLWAGLLLEERWRVRFADRWSFAAGGWFSPRLYSSMDRTDEVLDGPTPGSRNTSLGSDAQSPTLGFGAMASLGWRPGFLGGRADIELGLRVDGGNLIYGVGLRSLSFDLGFAVPFSSGDEDSATRTSPPPDTARDIAARRDSAKAADTAGTPPPRRVILPSGPSVSLVAEASASVGQRRVAPVRLLRIHRRLVLPPGREQIVERMEPPVLSIAHTVDTALRTAPGWLTLRMEGDTIGSWSMAEQPVDFPLRLDRSRLPTTLSAELRIERNDGGESVARDTLLLALDTLNVTHVREDLWLLDSGRQIPPSLERELKREKSEVNVAPYGLVEVGTYLDLFKRIAGVLGRDPELQGNGESLVSGLLRGKAPRLTRVVVTVRSR